MASNNETTTIGPASDIKLLVGTGDAIISLLVSSKVLTLISPIFSAMLGPSFREGKELSRSTLFVPFEKALQEDDPEAMRLLCLLTHSKSDSIPKEMPLSTVLKLVVLCDKYDCMEVMRLLARLWIVPSKITLGSKEAQKVLAMVYHS